MLEKGIGDKNTKRMCFGGSSVPYFLALPQVATIFTVSHMGLFIPQELHMLDDLKLLCDFPSLKKSLRSKRGKVSLLQLMATAIRVSSSVW